MNRIDRAKQFLPFDAMKGLAEAIRRQEEIYERVERRELGEEDTAALSEALVRVSRGDRVEAVCYREGRYLTRLGVVTQKDEVRRRLSVDGERIDFEDLISLSFLSGTE